MKTVKTIVTLLTLFVSVNGFASNNDTLTDTNAIKRDVQVSLTARIYAGNVYFKLTMLNESKPGMYSLVKIFDDGTIESVGMKAVGVNTINQPLLYSFKDSPLESRPYSYVLVRISHDVEVIGTWYCSYCSDAVDGVCIDKALFAEKINN